MSQIHVQWSHFLTAIGYCWFWWCFITKVWSVHHIIIAMFINGVCYRGSSEMSQIHVQWSHFLTAIGYCWFWWCCITKVWSVDHIIIVIYINGVCYRGSSEMCQIHVQWSHFSGLLVTVDFDDSFDTKVWSVDQWKLVLAKSLFCSILNFEIFCCIFEFCPYFRPYNAWIFTKKSPMILQKSARMKN